MAIIGFNLTKMLVEKKKSEKGKININTNATISGVEPVKLSIDPKKSAVRITFLYASQYEPGFAVIEMEGELLLLESTEKANEILNSWKTNKKLEKALMANLLNNILSRCTVQALLLSKEVNLPPPIRLPKIEAKA